MTVKSRKDRDGENVFDPRANAKAYSSGRINWWGRSEDWADRLGFRGPQDVESPGLEWTRLEAVVEKGNLTYYVNGKLVNAGTDVVLDRRQDHDPVGRRGDLLPADRSGADSVGSRRR